MDLFVIVQQLSSHAVSLSVPLIAIAVLTALHRRNEIKGFNFFIIGFSSQIILTVIGAIINIVSRWILDVHQLLYEFWAAAYIINTGIHIFLMSLFYFFISLGFLSLLSYKTRVNGLAIASAVLNTVSLFVPWFAAGYVLIAPTYAFPLQEFANYSSLWFIYAIVAVLTLSTYCFVIGSAFGGRIGRVLIVVGGILAFVSPFTYFLAFSIIAPWFGLAIPFVSTLIAYFALQNHPKELEKTMPESTGLTS